jgi:hypothetical protein
LPGQHIFDLGEEQEDLVAQLASGSFSHTNALLDCGAFLRDFRNLEVAELVLEVRPDIKAVLHYDDKSNKIVALPRPPLQRQVTSDTESLLSQWKLEYKDVFLYLDQQHTVGTDVRLGASAVAALTVSKKTNLEELMQAIMRMRNYQGEQYKNGEYQDVVYVFKGTPPVNVSQLWRNAQINSEKLLESTKQTVDRRKANSAHRQLYFTKQPPPTKEASRKYVEMVFQREQDFLKPDDPSQLNEQYLEMRKTMPFEMSRSERKKLEAAVSEALASAKVADAEAGIPGTEQELELELEQEAELQLERLRNDEDFNEDSFTNNPVQWAPMYALCDRSAVREATSLPHESKLFHPCAPVSSWVRSEELSNSPVVSSLAFSLVRPAPFSDGYSEQGKFHEELKKMEPGEKMAEVKRRMQLFEDPWTLSHNDEAQPAPLNSSRLLVSDYRKNVRNVGFVVDERDPKRFQFLLLTSDEAQEFLHFCKTREVDPPKTWGDFHFSADTERMEAVDACDDVQRAGYSPTKKVQRRYDWWQQVAPLGGDEATIDSLWDFLQGYWATRVCTVLTPTALPDEDDVLLGFSADATSFKELKRSLVEVLMLAGSEEVLERPLLKPEFFLRMQDPHYREIYRTVREKMGEPIDPSDLFYIQSQGNKCEKKCRGRSYEFESEDKDGGAALNCVCH